MSCGLRFVPRQAIDETGRNAALRPHPLQCLQTRNTKGGVYDQEVMNGVPGRFKNRSIEISMIVPKKSIGLIVLLFMPCFAVGQNFVDSTAFRQDSIDIRTDSLRQRNAMYNCGTVRKDSFPKQHRLFLSAKSKD